MRYKVTLSLEKGLFFLWLVPCVSSSKVVDLILVSVLLATVTDISSDCGTTPISLISLGCGKLATAGSAAGSAVKFDRVCFCTLVLLVSTTTPFPRAESALDPNSVGISGFR
jgi:hypothetical protein